MRALLKFYQWFVSPLIHLWAGPGSGCRFEPTCSRYAEEALVRHGTLKGSKLALQRVCRCHPWAASGYDPVPEA